MKSFVFAFFLLCLSSSVVAAKDVESSYHRVLRTNTLRCAWVSGGPYLYKDLKTGKVGGPVADLVYEMATSLGLKVDWVAEVGYADFAEGLSTGRYDAFCGILSSTPARARVAAFTDPYAYLPLFAYVRTEETRFNTLEDMNKPEVRAGVIDGEVFQALTRKYLPLAQEVSLPNMTGEAQLFTDLESKKTDVVIHDPFAKLGYENMNPGRVRKAFETPLGTNAMGFAVGPQDQALRDAMDVALLYLRNQGKIDAIWNSYNIDNTMLYRVPAAYGVPK